MSNDIDNRPEVQALFKNLKQNLPKLKELLTKLNSEWFYEDYVYRFYHQSYKLFHIQNLTQQIFKSLQELAPKEQLNEWFCQIFNAGTGNEFTSKCNNDWPKHTQRLLEAFFHAKFFLEMAVKYGQELTDPPLCMPSGYAALLYLYNMR